MLEIDTCPHGENPRPAAWLTAALLFLTAASACSTARPSRVSGGTQVQASDPGPSLAPAARIRQDLKHRDPTVSGPLFYGLKILQQLPHDPALFTQGLIFDGDDLLESSGLYGSSLLRRYDPRTGKVKAEVKLADRYFAEGLAAIDGRLYQLTWQEQTAFVYDQDSFTARPTLSYDHEGWGATTDGRLLVVSDGSETLRFYDPAAPEGLQAVRAIKVNWDGEAVIYLNELEWIDGLIWANLYGASWIVVIDPKDGTVVAWIDAEAIPVPDVSEDAVLNGIAYREKTGEVYLTGKYFPKLYSVGLVRQAR